MNHKLRNLRLFSVLIAAGLLGGACGSDSTSAPPTTPAPLGVPLAPTGLTATASESTAIELAWTAPNAGSGRHPVTGYRIEWSVDGVADWTPVEPPHTGTETAYRHAGLDPKTTRYYRVFASSAGGDSPASNLTRAETGPPAAPLAPSDLTATAAGQTVIELEWSAPASDPGRDPVTGYRIEWSADGVSDWTPVEPPHTGLETIYRHAGLDPETTRHYRVFALAAGGEGPASDAAEAATEEAFVITQQRDPELSGHLDLLEVAIYRTDADAVIVEFTLRDDVQDPPDGGVYSYRLWFDTDQPYWSHPVDFSDSDMLWVFDIFSNGRRVFDTSGTFRIGRLPSDEDNVLRMHARLPAGTLRISAMVFAEAVHFDRDRFVLNDQSPMKVLEIGR